MSKKSFITSPWTNGQQNHTTGSGFGIRIPIAVRNQVFQSNWNDVVLVTGSKWITAPITPSFWQKCSELRSREIGVWLIQNGLDIWPFREPPQLQLS